MRFYLAVLFCSFFAAALSDIAVAGTKPEPKLIRCPDFCTELYNPICASNKRCIATFNNPCRLDEYNCNNRKKAPFVQVDPKLCKHFSIPNFFYCRR